MNAAVQVIEAQAVAYQGLYKFLDYFEEKDYAAFAGRDRDIREITARIVVDNTVVLYGRSGLGKTSLILAGLFPELRSRGFVPVYCRVLEDPARDVEDAIRAQLGSEPTITLPEELSNKNVVLVLDQFEEFFIRFEKSQQAQRGLIDLLTQLLVRSTAELRVLISLREDYLARLDELRDQLPEMFSSEYRLRPLTAFGARQAITRPLINHNIEYEPKLVSHILDIIAVEEFDSLLLQIICSAVAAEAMRSGRNNKLLDADLLSIGGLEGILQRYIDSATREIPEELRLVTRSILDALITSENTKRAMTLGSLRNADFEAGEDEISTALKFLEKKRLIRREMRGSNVWYELTHERLVKAILAWFQSDRTFAEFRFAREVIVNGARNLMFRSRLEILLNREAVENVIGPFRDRLKLDDDQTEYVFRSAAYRSSSHVGFWATKLAIERCRSILLDLMKSDDVMAQRGSAYSASFVQDENSVLAKEVLRLAISGADVEIRKAAAETLSKLAGDSEILELRGCLRERANKRAALEALADFAENPTVFRRFNLVNRWRAKRIFRKRAITSHRESIRKKMKVGALSGVIGGLVWAFTISISFLNIVAWNWGATDYIAPIYSQRYTVFTVGALPVIIIAGVIFGLFVGRWMGKTAALNKPFPWWRIPIVLFVAVVGALMVGAASDNWEDASRPLAYIAFAAVLVATGLRFHAKLTSSAMSLLSNSITKRWGTGLLYAAAPFLFALPVGIAISQLMHDTDGLVTSLLVAYVWSAIVYIWSASLVEIQARSADHGDLSLRLYRNFPAKSFAVAIPLALAFVYFGIVGFRTIPIFAKRITLSGSTVNFVSNRGNLDFVPTRWLPTSSFVRLDQTNPTLYQLRSNSTVNLKSVHLSPGEFLYLPLQKWLANTRPENQVTLEPVPQSKGMLFLSPQADWQYIAVEFARGVDSQTWSAEIHIISAPDLGSNENYVEVAPLTQPPWTQPGSVVGVLDLVQSNSPVVRRLPFSSIVSPSASLPTTVAYGDVPLGFSLPWLFLERYGDPVGELEFSWQFGKDSWDSSIPLRLTFPQGPNQRTRHYPGLLAAPTQMSSKQVQQLPEKMIILLAYRFYPNPAAITH